MSFTTFSPEHCYVSVATYMAVCVLMYRIHGSELQGQEEAACIHVLRLYATTNHSVLLLNTPQVKDLQMLTKIPASHVAS